MTPAIELLKKQKIGFELLSYEHDPNTTNFGLEAAQKLNLNRDQVFKTIVLENQDGQLIVAITPVSQQVNLKLLASLCGAKKVAMAAAKKVQASTGYVLGGVSPLGQKKRLATFLHSSAAQFACIYVSAGKRGLDIAINPHELAKLTAAVLGEF
ncbi:MULTISPECIES: Cys-tRNA(Pro) deacylase [unclassified Pseudoalteromonas]|nr:MULTISPECIES: Cys-tRNA(Pro) deacylase [unclassified Pseudoalteromonas]MBB1371182.1 Cys-tRNA(Pro) deacylase [Pseudoalteromonas sp. SR45-4]MBH0072046.1 Cys-tRNA(Pro) deacylase [Pseudoalteromonas sp. NZS127]NYR11937.1 Cys-tRNA(Pro) deacylase [Pseudoalteromonas sp. MIP2626]PCC10658.1 Cys-tRNA(Pro) deacylase [Pseudoalteromonas sp. JB197]SJN37807.1 Cys-tRNA(Pro) deacylase YbaK [Pseudoalteromonas sp. JB197]|tara:strand:+ start:16921 stop:17382 length:462 start_codon:yes stop_codon:yes gene_type:complete